MASAKNQVIAGDYVGRDVYNFAGELKISARDNFSSTIPINTNTIAAYELVTDEHRKSAVSGAARGLVGGMLIGPVGALAGGLSAKSKGVYQVVILFKDGKKSLIEVNDRYYKELIKQCFSVAYDADSTFGSEVQANHPYVNDHIDIQNEPCYKGEMVDAEDSAYGDDFRDNPDSGQKPRNNLNSYNTQIAFDTVSVIDLFFEGKLNAEELKRKVEKYKEVIDFGDNDHASTVKLFDTLMSSIITMLSLGPSVDKMITIQDNRNHIARMYIVNEKIRPKYLAIRILNTTRNYLNIEIDQTTAREKIDLYTNTLFEYVLQNIKKGDSEKEINDDNTDYEKIQKYASDIRLELTNRDPDRKKLEVLANQISRLLGMDDSVTAETSKTMEDNNDSPAVKIRKYKELLDDGIITEEEFTKKKKELLGI